LPRGQPSAPALSSIYPSSRRSVLSSSYGYTCDIFPFKRINTTLVSIDTWPTSYTIGFFLPAYSYFLSIYDLRMAIPNGYCNMTGRIYHTYSSISAASQSRTLSSPSLSPARCRSSNWVISRFYFFPGFFSGVISEPCCISLSLVSYFFFFSSFSILYILCPLVRWCKNLIPLGYVVEKKSNFVYWRHAKIISLLFVRSVKCVNLKVPGVRHRPPKEYCTDQTIPIL
jgi:hypothetical protein